MEDPHPTRQPPDTKSYSLCSFSLHANSKTFDSVSVTASVTVTHSENRKVCNPETPAEYRHGYRLTKPNYRLSYLYCPITKAMSVTQRTQQYYKHYRIVNYYAVVFLLRPPCFLCCETFFERRDACKLSCTRLRVPPVALHVSQLISWIL